MWIRLEKVNLRKFHSVAKIIGTAITVAGAMVMTLYKGKAFQLIMTKGGSHHDSASTEPSDQHWILGTVYLIASLCSWAGFFILQVTPPPYIHTCVHTHYMYIYILTLWLVLLQSLTLKKYPAELSLTAWICVMGVIEGSIASFIMERDMNVWIIGWDSRLLACVYSVSTSFALHLFHLMMSSLTKK